MSTPASSPRDRRGRVYTPAIGPTAEAAALDRAGRLRPARGQRRLPGQRHRPDLVAGHHASRPTSIC